MTIRDMPVGPKLNDVAHTRQRARFALPHEGWRLVALRWERTLNN